MQTSPLIRFTLAGLDRCYMPERGLWSFKYHLDGRPDANEARPDLDVFYSLNVLLGFSRLSAECWSETGVDPRAMLHGVACRLLETDAPHYAYGMALWAAAELAVPVPDAILNRVLTMTGKAAALRRWRAQDLGLLLSGTVAQSRLDPAWTRLARTVRDIIIEDLLCDSGLFRDRAFGARRWFGTFATQVYCALSLYQYSVRFDDRRAGQAADLCVDRLIALQGPQGEWPWFYDAGRGRVLDYYEVYSVHQHGMGPALLKPAIQRGVPRARDALIKGFGWILGQNLMAQSMLRPELSLIARSQARAGWTGGRATRIGRSALAKLFSRDAILDLGAGALVITGEMRSYEFGWTLWSFGDDTDFAELTHSDAFGSVELPSSFADAPGLGVSADRASLSPAEAGTSRSERQRTTEDTHLGS